MRKEPYIIVDKKGDIVDYARSYNKARLCLVHSGDSLYKKLKTI